MAQPQGLNVPVILTTGIVGTIVIMTIIEGVRAYYNQYNADEEARRWSEVHYVAREGLQAEQKKNLSVQVTSIPIDEAIKKVIATGGKRPSTQPAK